MKFSDYVVKDHLLSRMDPRMKILVTTAVLFMVLSHRGFAFQSLIILLCLSLFASMKIPWRIIIARLSEPLLIVAVIVLIKLFFSGQEALFSIRFAGIAVEGHRDGLMEGIAISGRIVAAVSVVAAMVFSTRFTELIAALSWLRVPKGFVEILLYAYRYIFVLMEDAGVIYHAQKNRLGYASFRRSLNSAGILAGSLVLKAFEQSQTVTTAMTQRGYDGNMPVLRYKPLSIAEVFVSLLLITVLAIAWKI